MSGPGVIVSTRLNSPETWCTLVPLPIGTMRFLAHWRSAGSVRKCNDSSMFGTASAVGMGLVYILHSLTV